MSSPSDATARCVYEVSVSIPVADDAAYALYMKTDHIPAIMATGKFHDITMTSSLDSLLGAAAEPQWVCFLCCWYRLKRWNVTTKFNVLRATA